RARRAYGLLAGGAARRRRPRDRGARLPLLSHHGAAGLQDLPPHVHGSQSGAGRARAAPPSRGARGPPPRRPRDPRGGAAPRGLRVPRPLSRPGRAARGLGWYSGRSCLGRHRLAGGRLAHDEARLSRPLRPLPQRAVPARRLHPQGARAGGPAHPVAVLLAPPRGPLRGDPAGGRPVRESHGPRGGVPPTHAPYPSAPPPPTSAAPPRP